MKTLGNFNRSIIGIILLSLFAGCSKQPEISPYVIVLGIAQDGGVPHAGCQKNCCINRWGDPNEKVMVVSLGIVDPNSNETWIIEATPDFPKQMEILTGNDIDKLKGIFLTHAHIGHYTGLIHLGREVMGTKSIPVYSMPKMTKYLKANGPWRQLVELENIKIEPMKNNRTVKLNDRLSITPFIVPHRDEYSETVGYKIDGPNLSLIFIPDIDKWEKWDKNILDIVKKNDYALLDGSFYNNAELPHRDLSEIPHPFIIESMTKFKTLSTNDKAKIHFIHLNHTNPALIENSNETVQLKQNGFQVTSLKQVFLLSD
ncbi:MAG: MBL fold metallo-hydrolase [Candidatus Marinimicrobia bacterium]|nr:MBL fold metallo-hydrolase [Candidatus Neomarinimicrobiota bacterium]MBL7009670.1 MBL fold metallo-hydrolase [Candidatus Neomarinimicrobiota bacterium]MBL7029587.1 MBL fold metallo-hydrolase [Candidatus Neomarinimicrobiota bacterium]